MFRYYKGANTQNATSFVSVNVPNTGMTHDDFALGVHAEEYHHNFVVAKFCRVLCVRTLTVTGYILSKQNKNKYILIVFDVHLFG